MSISTISTIHSRVIQCFKHLQPTITHRPFASLPETCRGPPKALRWRAGGRSFILVLRGADVGLGKARQLGASSNVEHRDLLEHQLGSGGFNTSDQYESQLRLLFSIYLYIYI